MRSEELREKTRVELLEMARTLQIPNRSGMNKDELVQALSRSAASAARARSKEAAAPPTTSSAAPSAGVPSAPSPGRRRTARPASTEEAPLASEPVTSLRPSTPAEHTELPAAARRELPAAVRRVESASFETETGPRISAGSQPPEEGARSGHRAPDPERRPEADGNTFADGNRGDRDRDRDRERDRDRDRPRHRERDLRSDDRHGRTGLPHGSGGDEEEIDPWNSTALGRDPNYGRFLEDPSALSPLARANRGGQGGRFARGPHPQYPGARGDRDPNAGRDPRRGGPGQERFGGDRQRGGRDPRGRHGQRNDRPQDRGGYRGPDPRQPDTRGNDGRGQGPRPYDRGRDARGAGPRPDSRGEPRGGDFRGAPRAPESAERRDERELRFRYERSERARQELQQSGEARRGSGYVPHSEGAGAGAAEQRSPNEWGRSSRRNRRERGHSRDRGDEPRGEGRGFAPPSELRPARRPEEVPERVGIDRCEVVARDPYWLYAFWEITEPTFERLRDQLGEELEGSRAILRVHSMPAPGDPDGQPPGFFDLEIDQTAVSWYIHAGIANRLYRVELGIVTPNGVFHPLVSSGVVATPPDRPGSSAAAEESEIPAETRADLERPSTGAAARKAARWSAQQAEVPPAGIGSAGPAPAVRYGEARDPRGEWEGESDDTAQRSRDEWPEPRPVMRNWSPKDASGEASATSPAARSPQAIDSSRPLRFFLNTELVVYGATEPGAQLTLQGRPVSLRSDGTFTLRFALPDGEFSLPAIARSADGLAVRAITPTIRRTTRVERRDEVDRSPESQSSE